MAITIQRLNVRVTGVGLGGVQMWAGEMPRDIIYHEKFEKELSLKK